MIRAIAVVVCLLFLAGCAQDGLCVRNLITGTCSEPTQNLQCAKGPGRLDKHGRVICPQ